jgi:hypothetical protein
VFVIRFYLPSSPQKLQSITVHSLYDARCLWHVLSEKCRMATAQP